MSTIQQHDILGVILAGGAGKRFEGRDKGLEPLAGCEMVKWVANGLRPQVHELLIVANRNTDRYALIAPVISDAAPGFHGPMAGIAAALTATTKSWIVTVPVDCPTLPAAFVERLLAAVLASNKPAAVAHNSNRRQPLFALYSRDLADSAAQALAQDLAIWRWQDAIGACEVMFADNAESFANLNTPEEFREWECNHE